MRLFAIAIAIALLGLAPLSGDAFAATGGKPLANTASEAQLRRECNVGRAASCGELGQILREKGGESPREMKRAVAMFQRACDGGDIIGCGDLAQSYLFGEGVAIDEAKAVRLSADACRAGGEIGCALMGIILEQGKGGYAKSDVRARAYFGQACRSSQPRWEFPCERAEALAARISRNAPPQPVAVAASASQSSDSAAMSPATIENFRQNEVNIVYFEANKRLTGKPYFTEVSDLAVSCLQISQAMKNEGIKGVSFKGAWFMTYGLIVQQKGLQGENAAHYIKSNEGRINDVLQRIYDTDPDKAKNIVNFCRNSFPE